jgi:hypothetical protein
VAASVAAVLVVAGVVLGVHWSSSTSTSPRLAQPFSGPCQDDFVAGPSTYKRRPPPAFQNLRVTLRYRGVVRVGSAHMGPTSRCVMRAGTCSASVRTRRSKR